MVERWTYSGNKILLRAYLARPSTPEWRSIHRRLSYLRQANLQFHRMTSTPWLMIETHMIAYSGSTMNDVGKTAILTTFFGVEGERTYWKPPYQTGTPAAIFRAIAIISGVGSVSSVPAWSVWTSYDIAMRTSQSFFRFGFPSRAQMFNEAIHMYVTVLRDLATTCQLGQWRTK